MTRYQLSEFDAPVVEAPAPADAATAADTGLSTAAWGGLVLLGVLGVLLLMSMGN